MTRSIFDPTGGEAERSGSRFTPQSADNISPMPPDVVDGEVSEQEAMEAQGAADESPNSAPASIIRQSDAGDEYDH